MELTLFFNAFYGISKALKIPKKEGWTYWKNSSFPAIFVLLIFVAPIEIFVVHYLLNINSILLNGILIFFYISSFLYIYGFWVSIKLHPHLISEKEVVLYRGCLSKISFPLGLVISANLVTGTQSKKEDSVDLTILGGQAVEIVFSSQVKVENLIGKERFTERVFVTFDEPQKFCNQINKAMD